jgi:tripartite-type tricarboxylate transporter receptor subunit TctC
VIVENMPGAGGKVAANHLVHVVRPDGLTIAHLGESNAADAVDSDLLARLHILVSPAPLTPLMLFSARSGIASVDDWRRARRAPRIASSGPAAASYVVPRLVARALGLPVEMVSGYSGSAEMRLALESGEVDGVCLSFDTFRTAFSASASLRPVLRFSRDPLPGIDAPDAMSLATDDTARALLETGVYAMSGLERFYAAPRDVPAPRISVLREGLMRTLADPQFLAAAAAAGLTVRPLTAGDLEERLRLIATRREILAVVRSIVSGR